MNREDVIRLLQSGEFRNRTLEGKLVETHISWVILTREFVFKIKKPMQYSFLDFSTLEKRKYYCEREVELNRRITNDVYLNVLPIKRAGEHYSIGTGEGRIIEYVVHMKRLQTAKEMDRVMKANRLNRLHIERLAKKIAQFHNRARIIRKPFVLKSSTEEFNDIASVSKWVTQQLGKRYFEKIDRAIRWSNTYLKQHQKLISTRIKNGLQRDVHGDLHARNIFLYKDPIIFDCIEFNDDFRRIDVLKEVAYFCMDLDAFDQHELSNYFMKLYLEDFPCISSDADWKLFNYYKCYRANVRAKVNSLRAMQTDDADYLERCSSEVIKYIDLMEHYIS